MAKFVQFGQQGRKFSWNGQKSGTNSQLHSLYLFVINDFVLVDGNWDNLLEGKCLVVYFMPDILSVFGQHGRKFIKKG